MVAQAADGLGSVPRNIVVLGGDALWSVARVLRQAGLDILDAEPAPKQISDALANNYGFGAASVRAGALGDLRLVAQLLRQARDGRPEDGIVWSDADGAPIDALRADVEPAAETAEEVLANQAAHLAALRRAVAEAGLIVLPLRGVEVVECGGLLFPRSSSRLKPPKSRRAKAAPPTDAALIKALDEILTLVGAEISIRLICPPGQEGDLLRPLAGRLAQRFDRVMYHPLVDELLGRLEGSQAPEFASMLARVIGAQDVLSALACAADAPADPALADKGQDKAAKRARKEARARRRARDGADTARIICEDELLEAFS